MNLHPLPLGERVGVRVFCWVNVKSEVMRICHIVTSLEMGGMERVVCDLLAGMAARGFPCYLFCTDKEGALYEGALAQAKVCAGRRPRKLVIDWGVLWKLVRFIRVHKINCIHTHNHVAHLYGVLASFVTGIPVVATWHGQGYQDKWRVRFLKRILAQKTKTVVIVSEDSKRVAVGNGSVSECKAKVIPNGINTRVFMPLGEGSPAGTGEKIAAETAATTGGKLGGAEPSVVAGVPTGTGEKSAAETAATTRGKLGGAEPSVVAGVPTGTGEKSAAETAATTGGKLGGAEPSVVAGVPAGTGEKSAAETAATTNRGARARRGIPEDAVVIGSVGRLSVEKNYRLLVRAFARVADQANGFLLLVGDGLDRGCIEGEISRLNLKDRCLITGMQSEVRFWLQLMDIFCLSSDTEGLSISLLEAGACGLPGVVTDAGGNREIIVDEQSGLVVPIRDEAALAAGLKRLLCNVNLRRSMGAAARRVVEARFSLDAMINGYVKVYGNALR